MVSLCLHPLLFFFLQACFLIPLGVSIYVVVGGMRSTLLCD
jgi:Na+/proline symporter